MKRSSEVLTPVKSSKKSLFELDSEPDCAVIEESIIGRVRMAETDTTKTKDESGPSSPNLSDDDAEYLRRLLRHPKFHDQQINDLREAIDPVNKKIDKLTNNLSFMNDKMIEQEHSFKTKLHEQNVVIRTSLDQQTKKIESWMNAQTSRITVIEDKISNVVDPKIARLEAEVRRLDMMSKECNLKITGMAEETNEAIGSRVVSLIKDDLDMSFSLRDIQDCHRIGAPSPGKTRFVHLKLFDKGLRNSILRKKLILQKKGSPIFINEALTGYNGEIFYETRGMARDKKIYATWIGIGTGRVFVRKTSDSDSILIDTKEKLTGLKESLGMSSPNVSLVPSTPVTSSPVTVSTVSTQESASTSSHGIAGGAGAGQPPLPKQSSIEIGKVIPISDPSSAQVNSSGGSGSFISTMEISTQHHF